MEFCDVIQSFGDWDEKTHGKKYLSLPLPSMKKKLQ
jgi:hypothetical protein